MPSQPIFEDRPQRIGWLNACSACGREFRSARKVRFCSTKCRSRARHSQARSDRATLERIGSALDALANDDREDAIRGLALLGVDPEDLDFSAKA